MRTRIKLNHETGRYQIFYTRFWLFWCEFPLSFSDFYIAKRYETDLKKHLKWAEEESKR